MRIKGWIGYYLIFLGLLFVGEKGFCNSVWDVLPHIKENVSNPREMMKNYLNLKAMRILKDIEGKEDYIPTPETFDSWKENRIKSLWSLLGGMPEKFPLNPVVVRKGEKSTFKYEVLYFESMPGLYVPSVLFLPNLPAPYPAMIIPCGHAQEGKGFVEYQKMCILLAQNGIASLIYDPPGQGERITFVDDSGRPLVWGTAEHTAVGMRCILLGMNYALFEIWDGIRAIDYLSSRDDIDKTKIGCAGNSGGGTQTAYLMALDERIKFSAPSCYITSLERLLTTIGPQDAEQNIYSQIVKGIDHSDYLILNAPKPFLICCATYDFFDIQGTWHSYRRAKRLYSKFGVNSSCDIIEVDKKHGWSEEMREEIAERVLFWFYGRSVELEEKIEDTEVLEPNEYRVTLSGNVKEVPNYVSIPDLLIDKLKIIKESRDKRWSEFSREERKKVVMECLGISDICEVREPKVIEISEDFRNIFNLGKMGRVRKLVIMPEEGIYISVLVFEPEEKSKSVVLFTSPKGKAEIGIEKVQDYLLRGKCVVVADLRGIGETACEGSKNDITSTSGVGWEDYFRAYLLGESFVGMWVEDYSSIWRFLEKEYGGDFDLFIVANGMLCIPALHFAYLLNSQRVKLKLENMYFWEDLVNKPKVKGQIMSAVNGGLLWYDMFHLISELGGENVEYSRGELPVF
ncbi:MAG: hypothetical protein N3G21_02050 [Candidatus Hydrogenedentes bacterium]|nr:hypothetical protein [Candidatus Hydrogenedentota bacterium]